MNIPDLNPSQATNSFGRFEQLGSDCKRIFEIVWGYLQHLQETYFPCITIRWRAEVEVPAVGIQVELEPSKMPEEERPHSCREVLQSILAIIFEMVKRFFNSDEERSAA